MSKKRIEKTTEELDKLATESDILYRPFPHPMEAKEAQRNPVWRIRFEVAKDPDKLFGLDINDDIIFGRGNDTPEVFDLNPYGASKQGVSRLHLMLRPTPNKLLAIELGSLNGTLRNGRAMGRKIPYSLMSGDKLALGRFELVVHIVDRPRSQTTWLARELNLADAMTEIGQAITSQLELEEVFNQVTETAHALTAAGETSIWLIDEQTGELLLEAERGVEDERIRRMRIPIDLGTPAGRVIESGESLRMSRQPDEAQIKVKTDYLVEALIYIPIKLGRVAFGVLSAVHREQGNRFSERDEHLLRTIAQYAAIAIQNARLYEATDKQLAQRVTELSALNVENARLFAEAKRQRAATVATAQVLRQPLLLLGNDGRVLITNQAARNVLETHMAQLFDAISKGVGHTQEVEIGEKVYLTTVEHVEDVGTIVVMQDITYVKQLEQERVEFIHALSHDMKNPLSSIIAWTHLIQQVSPLNEKGQLYMRNQLRAADAILTMINQLLRSVEMVDTGQLVKERCRLEDVVARAISDMEGIALSKGSTIYYEQTGTPYPLMVDELRLYHMLLNLLDNALKYSPEDSQVQVRLNFTAEAIILQVEDQGPGIPEEETHRIFDRYVRGTQSGKKPGTGIGLSVVKDIVAAHEGEIVAGNKPGRGSVFTVTLPSGLHANDSTTKL